MRAPHAENLYKQDMGICMHRRSLFCHACQALFTGFHSMKDTPNGHNYAILLAIVRKEMVGNLWPTAWILMWSPIQGPIWVRFLSPKLAWYFRKTTSIWAPKLCNFKVFTTLAFFFSVFCFFLARYLDLSFNTMGTELYQCVFILCTLHPRKSQFFHGL